MLTEVMLVFAKSVVSSYNSLIQMINDEVETMKMKKLGLLCMCIFVTTTTGCSTVNNNKLEDIQASVEVIETSVQKELTVREEQLALLNTQIDSLEAKISDLEEKLNTTTWALEDYKEEEAVMLKTLGMAEKFVDAYIAKDYDTMEKFMDDSISVDGKGIHYKYDGNDYTWPWVKGQLEYQINSLGYIKDDRKMFYQFMVYDGEPKGVENSFFLDLTLQNDGGVWKITLIEYDI